MIEGNARFEQEKKEERIIKREKESERERERWKKRKNDRRGKIR
jgi:hypothetical protein